MLRVRFYMQLVGATIGRPSAPLCKGRWHFRQKITEDLCNY